MSHLGLLGSSEEDEQAIVIMGGAVVAVLSPRIAWFEIVHDEIRWHLGRQFVRIPRRSVIVLNLEDGLEANQTTVTLADMTERRLPDEILRYDLSNIERLGVSVCEAWPEVRVVRGLRSQGYKPFQPKS